MKYLFLILSLISYSAFACKNTAPISSVIQYISTPGTPGVECKDKPNDQCLCFDHIYSWSSTDIVDNLVDDIYHPNRDKTSIEVCSGEVACKAALLSKVCEGSEAFIDAEYTEVYCSKIVGYPQILTGKKLVINEARKAAELALSTQNQTLNNALALAERSMDCGKSVQALMLVRNASKNLTTTQVKEIVATYAPVKALLDTGSLVSAAEEILATEADGVLVTEGDKTALVAHLNACKP